jgi:hypothetical protein
MKEFLSHTVCGSCGEKVSASSVCLNNNKYTHNIFPKVSKLVRVFQFFMGNLFGSFWILLSPSLLAGIPLQYGR